MKKSLKIIGLFILLVLCFRGLIYRQSINYSKIGTRAVVQITNKALIHEIELYIEDKEIGIQEIINIANLITVRKLRFSRNKVSNNPNELIITGKANCVGYSAMFNSIANYLINQYNLENKIQANHLIGKLDFLGIDLHQFLNSSFFKDHDFNEIIDLETKEVISIDPTVSDYLEINKVSAKSK